MSIRPEWWMSLQAFLFPFIQKLLRETQTTLLGRLSGLLTIPVLSGKNFDITYLPIHQKISGGGDALLPRKVLQEIIRRSAHRTIIKKCTCRDGNQCKSHPIELGCLLLGEGSREIDIGVSRHVGVDEALEHVDQCIENGLVPFVGRFKADNYIWGVRDQGKLLTVCFCCRCCCIIQNSVKYLPDVTKESVVKLKGLIIETDHSLCNTCSRCVEVCFIGARSLQNGTIVYDAGLCKGCGHCVAVCQESAIQATVSDLEEAVADVLDRIERLITYD